MRRILSSVIQAQRSQTGFENKLFAPFYSQNKAKNFSTHIVCVWTSSSVHQCPLKSGILDTRITLDNHFRVIHVCFSRCFLHSKTSLSLLHVFRRLLQCCFAVKKCFVDFDFTDFSIDMGLSRQRLNLNFWANYPLKGWKQMEYDCVLIVCWVGYMSL